MARDIGTDESLFLFSAQRIVRPVCVHLHTDAESSVLITHFIDLRRYESSAAQGERVEEEKNHHDIEEGQEQHHVAVEAGEKTLGKSEVALEETWAPTVPSEAQSEMPRENTTGTSGSVRVTTRCAQKMHERYTDGATIVHAVPQLIFTRQTCPTPKICHLSVRSL